MANGDPALSQRGVMAAASPSAPTRRERVVRKLATLIVWGVYRRVDVYRADGDHAAGPRMSVANHFGGFADPLLLMAVLPRLPRIIARDVIWKIPVAGSVMNWLGGIPVHKPRDKGERSNDVMFAEAYDALADGAHLMIFPEGVTRDDPSIAPIKTGAARIVLGARSHGVDRIQIAPAGIHYEDKAALRSAVSIQLGRPIDIDGSITRYVAPGTDPGPSNRDAVRKLTDEIDEQLRRAAPDFADWAEARALTHGAEMLLRSLADDPTEPVPIATRDRIAGQLGRAPGEQKATTAAAVTSYDRDLAALGLTDAWFLSGMTGRRFLGKLLWSLVLAIALLPFAIAGAVINWFPYLVVKAVGLLRFAPAVMATIKPMAAIVVFGATWGFTVWAAFRSFGLEGAALAVLLIPVYLVAVIVFTERAVHLWRAFRAWRGLRRAADMRDTLAARRREVVAEVVNAL